MSGQTLDLLLLAALAGVPLGLILRPLLRAVPALGWVTVALYGLQIALLIQLAPLGYGADPVTSSLSLNIFGQVLSWRYDALSWFFAVITVGAAFASSLYMVGSWSKQYEQEGGSAGWLHVALAANVFAMLLLIGSGDFVSLFIGWELVSWASFLMMLLSREDRGEAALRYITYATGGAMALFAALALVYAWSGSFQFAEFAAALPGFTTTQILLLVLTFGVGFGVKLAILPFHLWQPEAYSLTPGPGTAFLGAISSRMGLYAMIVVFAQLIGLGRLAEIAIPWSFMNLNTLIAWIAVATIIFPTFTALLQTDARRLLAWHGIGQGGYMLLGLVTLHPLGSAGGILHVFNYATYQAALLLAVYAVMMRTGTADLNRLGGLVARMPFTFLVMLLGIIGLAGLPPLNGFVSKWLIYRTLVDQGAPLLFVGAVIGTLGTILSVFKLIHNTFLGQLRLEHEKIAEASWPMVSAMLLLCVIAFLTGMFPGVILDWVASIQATVGLPVIQHHLGGVTYKGGGLDMIWITLVLLYGIGVGAILFSLGGRVKRVHQLDNYAGGHFLTAQSRYHYSDHFYPGLMRRIGPLYRGSFLALERAVINASTTLGGAAQQLYARVQPTLLLLVAGFSILLWVTLR